MMALAYLGLHARVAYYGPLRYSAALKRQSGLPEVLFLLRYPYYSPRSRSSRGHRNCCRKQATSATVGGDTDSMPPQ